MISNIYCWSIWLNNYCRIHSAEVQPMGFCYSGCCWWDFPNLLIYVRHFTHKWYSLDAIHFQASVYIPFRWPIQNKNGREWEETNYKKCMLLWHVFDISQVFFPGYVYIIWYCQMNPKIWCRRKLFSILWNLIFEYTIGFNFLFVFILFIFYFRTNIIKCKYKLTKYPIDWIYSDFLDFSEFDI